MILAIIGGILFILISIFVLILFFVASVTISTEGMNEEQKEDFLYKVYRNTLDITNLSNNN